MVKSACLRFFLLTLAGVAAHGPHDHHHHHHHDEDELGQDHVANRNLVRKGRGHAGGSDYGLSTFAAEVIQAGSRGKGWKKDAPFSFDGAFYRDSGEFVKSGKACRTQDLDEERRKEVQEEVKNFIRDKFGSKGIRHLQTTEMVINTYIHVVYKNNSTDPTNVPEEMITKQLKILNDSYKGVHAEYTTDCTGATLPSGTPTPFRFNLKNITRTLNNGWHGGLQDASMVPALRVGTCSDLNIFINNAQGFLGYASFASACRSKNLASDFVTLNWATLPGASVSPFAEGDTAVHEVGHWLGAEHTFAGGCDGVGDSVTDTTPESSAAFGCPAGRDTCVGGGPDPIINFMDYTDDCCMHTFTSGQNTRMMEQVITYRNITFTNPPPSAPVGAPMSWPVSAPVFFTQAAPTSIGPITCSSSQSKVEVVMNLDEYAEETSYKIVQTSTNTVVDEYQGTASVSKSTVIKSSCLENNKMYLFIIKDSYGDGMQGFLTLGTYEVKVNGVTKGSGGNFLREDLVMFGKLPTCSSTEKPFTAVVQTDNYGAETSYILTNLSTAKNIRSKAYNSNTLNIDEICLAPADYRFRMRDSSADGICCGYGYGYYAIYSNGVLLKKGAQFGSTENTNFAVI